jgi:NAD(P)-dependent dehydrogenase (short-subunit alcohol dehydrogenase family)
VGDFTSVKAFAERVEKELDRVDVLLSNAGIATSVYSEMSDGWESTLAVNVIGTFLLVILMMPKMRETAKRHKTMPHLTVTASGAGHLVSTCSILGCAAVKHRYPGTDNRNSRPSLMSAKRKKSSKLLMQTATSSIGTACPSFWKSSPSSNLP